ncbi:MAG TPA: TraB/GumN family protein, partial [Chitinophagaceae bacterium]|nr:TraB/GumN family protein [Chitinophagaceae bacterium]
MRRFVLLAFLLHFVFGLKAQSKFQIEKKYPSLFWEISGKGLRKTSFLFGTMHVSSKMAFNLSDSFYIAIRKADVVALETNPESWQEDMLEFNRSFQPESFEYRGDIGNKNAPSDYLRSNTLKFRRYENLLEAALSSHPSTINNLLYRAYSERNVDFEEDTYLDLYIYQAGKKWRKKVVGVEHYAESMKLAMEAYADAMNDKERKDRSFEPEDEFSYAKLQEAYRNGNLDLLDTIGRVNSMSAAFDEKFLYRRNEIQASSIDSIIRSGSSLFVGVGAAHLPGGRGVIEMLRQLGYTLRPIKMGSRSSHYKDELEGIKVPVQFISQASTDGFYTVEAPGKLQSLGNSVNGFHQVQYADMANGSYYTITRVQTNAASWGHDPAHVVRKVDSLLYENIPGKIISKGTIVRNGYEG